MSRRREALNHVKLNILSKSQMAALRKEQNSSSLRNKESLNRKVTVQELQREETSSTGSSSWQQDIGQNHQYSQIENVEVSQFTYSKLSLIQKNLFFCTITMFFFGFLLVESQTLTVEPQAEHSLLLLLSLMAFVEVTLVIFRKLLVLQLKIDQKQIYHYNRSRCTRYLGSAFAALISNQDLVLQLALEIIIAFMHPNLLTKGLTYTLYDEEYDMDLTLSINNLLGVMMVLKLAIVIRSLVNLTKFVTPRVIRVCNMNQVDYSVMYSIKCIQKEYPIRFVFIAVTLILVTFGYGFRLSEGTVANLNPIDKSGFEELPNCFWFAFQTMYTIGYGQYIPRTIVGRFLAACLSVMGIGINSMLMVSVFDYISMSNQQQKSLTLIHRMNNRIQMQTHASQAMAQLAEINQLLRSGALSGVTLQGLQSCYRRLKIHLNESKQFRQNIKNLIPLNDQTESMIHQFTILRQNLSEVCRNQIDVHKLLQDDKLNSSRTRKSISEHFKSFIKKTLTRSPPPTVAEA